MKYIFPYQPFGIFYRPVIPITIRCNNISVGYYALIDSGADFNIFHADLTKILKIDLKKIKPFDFGGIKKDAKGKGYFYSLEIGIGQKFFLTTAVFSYDISDEDGYGVLGQQGFFQNFKVNFDY